MVAGDPLVSGSGSRTGSWSQRRQDLVTEILRWMPRAAKASMASAAQSLVHLLRSPAETRISQSEVDKPQADGTPSLVQRRENPVSFPEATEHRGGQSALSDRTVGSLLLERVTPHRWWIGRILALPLHLMFFAIAVFALVRLIPGDPVYLMTAGTGIDQETYDRAADSLGLSGSLFDQFRNYSSQLLRLDFGSSIITGTPVMDELSVRLPQTLQLALISLFAASLLTAVIGYLVVFHPQSLVARLLGPYARAAGALPDFCLGVAGIFVFYYLLSWVPAPIGLIDPGISSPQRITGFSLIDALLTGNGAAFASIAQHLVLPVLVLAIAYAPLLLKIFVRALEDAVVAAPTMFRLSCGVPRRTVVESVARRALPTTVAMFGTVFGFLIGGAVIVEQLFAMPGMGQYAVNAVNSTDLIALQGFLLVTAGCTLVVFLVVDIVNMLLDPRRRPGAGQRANS